MYFRHNAVPADAEEIGLLDFRGYNSASEDTRYVIMTAKAEDVTNGTEDGSLTFSTMTAGTATKTLTLNSSNVGIGTDSPDNKLEIVGSNALRIHDGINQGTIFFRGDRSDVYIKELNFRLLFGAPSGMVFELDTNNNDNDSFNVTHRGVSKFYVDGPTGNTDVAGTFQAYGQSATFAGQIITTQNQITTNIATTSAIRLKPGAITNTTGKSSIFLGTSTADNNGISLKGARKGTDGTPTFEVGTHSNSADGATTLAVNNHSLRLHTNMRTAGEFDGAQLRIDSRNTTDNTGFQGMRFATSTSANYGWSMGANRSSSGRGSIRFYEHTGSNAGTERFTLLQDGNVGVGTASPEDKLHVSQGSDAFRGITIEGTTPALYLKDTQATNAYHIGANGNYLYFLEDSNQSGAYNNIMAYWDPSNNFIFQTGNVGIGTSSPASKLHVAGTVQVGADDTGHNVKFFGATSGASFLYDQSEDGVIITAPLDETALSLFTISSAQPTVPQFKVGRDASQYLGIKVTDTVSSVIHRQDETSGVMKMNQEIWDNGNGIHTWNWISHDGAGANPSVKMTLDKNAKLDVNGEVQCNSLDVDGAADISGKLVLPQTSTTIGTAYLANASLLIGSENLGIGIDNNEIVANGSTLNISTIGNTSIQFRTAATEVLTLSPSQNVGIGVNSPSRKLHIDQTSTSAGGAYIYSNAVHTGTTTNSLVSIRQDHASSSGTVLDVRGDGTGDKLIVWDTAVAALIVKDGGNVGVGTDSPAATLHAYKSGTSGSQTIVAVIGSDSRRPVLAFSESTGGSINHGMSIEYDGRGDGSANQMLINGVDGAAKFTVTSGGDATIVGDLTVSGGDITLGGTGRIQGIDTVSADTDAANKTYVDTSLANLVDSAPGTLNTLNELAAALGDDASFSTTVTNSIATKLPLAGGTMTGNTIHNDNVKSIFGAGSDLSIYHDGTNSYIDDTGTGRLRFKSSSQIDFLGANGESMANMIENGAVKLYHNNVAKFETTATGATITGNLTVGDSHFIGDDASDNLLIQGSANEAVIIDSAGDIFLNADGGDVVFKDDSTEFGKITNASGSLIIRNDTADKDIILKADDGSGSSTAYFTLDGSAATHDGSATTALHTVFPDKSYINLGTGSDFQMHHNGVDTILGNNTGNLKIRQFANDKDIIFDSDDGSGGVTTYLTLDGGFSVPYVALEDSAILALGTHKDLLLTHDGTNSKIDNMNTGDLKIRNFVDDKDIVFQCDDGSGGVTTYLTLDGSAGRITSSKDILYSDNVKGLFGNSGDLKIHHNATNSVIENHTGNLIITNNTDDGDIVFQSDDGSGGVETYFFVDGSLGVTRFTNSIFAGDDVQVRLGNGNDLKLYHDATDSIIENGAGNLIIRNNTDDKDILFQSDNGSGALATYFFLDGSIGYTVVQKQIRFNDNVKAVFGTGSDLSIDFSGTNGQILQAAGDLYITNSANDKDILFQSDDGSGGVTTYIGIDGSSQTCNFLKKAFFGDGIEIRLGSSSDFQLEHDGTNSLVTNATGNLIFTQNADDGDIVFKSDNGSGGVATYFYLDGSLVNGSSVLGAARFPDKSNIYMGTGGDLLISHDGSNSFITNATGDLTAVSYTHLTLPTTPYV